VAVNQPSRSVGIEKPPSGTGQATKVLNAGLFYGKW